MDIITYFTSNWNIDPHILLIVLMCGYAQKTFLKTVWIKKDLTFDERIKTLTLSTIVSAIYIWLVYLEHRDEPVPYAMYFVSFAAANLVYQYALHPLTKFLKRLGENEVTEDTNTSH